MVNAELFQKKEDKNNKGQDNKDQDNKYQNIIEILALIILGKIKREDLSQNNRSVPAIYFEIMENDPEFAAQVNLRVQELRALYSKGVKIPLFPPKIIDGLKKRRRRKKTEPVYVQPRLLSEQNPEDKTDGTEEDWFDPEKKLFKLGADLDKRSYHRNFPKDSIIMQEIKKKQTDLRNLIGLPVARGKDPHVNDDFYKYLVRRVYKRDIFGIFMEYDRVLGKIPQELDHKINEVKELINELLNTSLNKQQRYKAFNQFVQEYQNRWGISKFQ